MQQRSWLATGKDLAAPAGPSGTGRRGVQPLWWRLSQRAIPSFDLVILSRSSVMTVASRPLGSLEEEADPARGTIPAWRKEMPILPDYLKSSARGGERSKPIVVGLPLGLFIHQYPVG